MNSESSIPLSKEWTFYAHKECNGTESYNTSFKKIGTAQTMQEWGAYMYHIPSVEILTSAEKAICVDGERIVSYSMFSDNILPSWEDNSNTNGKEWSCKMEKTDPRKINALWRYLCADCVLENINANGIRITKKEYFVKVEIWMNEFHDEYKVYEQIVESIKSFVDDNLVFSLFYHSHYFVTPSIRKRKKR